jgi:hypothetical protein
MRHDKPFLVLSVEDQRRFRILDVTVQRQPRRENLARYEIGVWIGERGTLDGVQVANYGPRQREVAEKHARAIARALAPRSVVKKELDSDG